MATQAQLDGSLGQALVAVQKISRDQLDYALGEKRKRGQGKGLGSLLVELGYLKEEDITETLGQLYNMPTLKAQDVAPSLQVLQLISEETIRKYKVFPLFLVGNELTVALTDPSEYRLLDLLRDRTHLTIQPVIISNSDFVLLLEKHFAQGAERKGLASILDEQAAAAEGVEDAQNLERAGRELPVVELVDKILLQAVRDQASDIHFEPTEDSLRVRFRIDGILYEQLSLARNFKAGVISRLKIVAGLDISERQIPQDGRIRIVIQDRPIDVRVSTLPTSHGEKVVLRILDQKKAVVPLDQLGFSASNLQSFNKLLTQPYGVILVTGPTGSGKTTTLYSALATIDASKFNIITVEDPVEYQLPRINQVPINPRRGLSFALALRAILRQDPDIVLVGEIRDPETGNIAAEAALTGHLVFATLHTNDAASTIYRLMEIGVEPYLVAPSLVGIIAQRLVRNICPSCAQTYAPNRQELFDLGLGDMRREATFRRGQGCTNCSFRGYLGRTAIHEVLTIDETMRDFISRREPITTLRDHLRQTGFRDMRFDGLKKIASGITTVEEVLRVTRDIQ